MGSPIIEIDLHGLRQDEAQKKIDQILAKADAGTYQVRLIHGFHRGTSVNVMIRSKERIDTN